MTSGHLITIYLPNTENWLYTRLSGLTRYSPVVYTLRRVDGGRYSLPTIKSFEGLPAWKRMAFWMPPWQFGIKLRDGRFHWRELLQDRCTVLHSHFGWTAMRYGPLRLRARKELGCATVTSFYGNDLKDLKSDRGAELSRLFKEETAFIVEGPFMANRIVEAGCLQEKVHINALGIDVSLFPERTPGEGRGGEVKVLTVGRLVEKKGTEDAITAVAEVRRRGVPIRMTVVGDGPLRSELEGKVRKENAGEFVRLEGMAYYPRLVALYYSHDILLQPSVTARDGDSEGGAPVSIAEGMAASMAVVSTRHADIPNVVVEGENALLADERRPDLLSEALHQLASDPELLLQFGRNGRRRALECFDCHKQSLEMEKVYDRILGRKSAPLAVRADKALATGYPDGA